jgi:4a-hydroxytetrahydrobiopterin dehydratase
MRSMTDELAGWSGGTDHLTRRVECPTFPAAITLVNRVAEQAEAMNHHPDIDIRWRTVTFTLSTHSAGHVTDLDITLAHHIDRLVDEL